MTNLLLNILLQIPTDTATTNPVNIISEYFNFGAIGLVASTFIFLYYKERQRNNKQAKGERERLVKEKDEAESRTEMLYNEIKVGQKDQNEKLIQVINRQNEIGEKNIDALIRNNTLFEQLLNYFINNKK